jgi:hypothetical protein
VAIAKNGNSFLFLLDNLAHEQRTTIKACAQVDDKRQRPTVSTTGAFPVFTAENSQLFYFRWPFPARAYPFRHPRLSRSGTAECSMPRAKVPAGADGFARDCSVNVMELHPLSCCPRHATGQCAFPPSSRLRGGIAPR